MGSEKIKVRSYHRWQQQKNKIASTTITIYYGGECRILNYSNSRSDVYEFKGDVRMESSTSTIFIASMNHPNIPHTIKPHPRKFDADAMNTISAFEIKAAPPEQLPDCSNTLDAPAILFSTGGHAGNHFHRFSDVLIPLFVTSLRFNRDVIFLVTNHDSRLTSQHRKTLEILSRYEVVDIDRENQTLCFPNVIVGLRAHEHDLSIDPSPFSSFSTRNFTKLLRSAYSLERDSVGDHYRPRMLLIPRTKSRRLTNEVEVVELARRLGFDSVVHKVGHQLESAAKIVNSFDVMVGVHGAALTNMLFLPENAIVIQITPVGLHNFARTCYGRPPEEMKLKYLEYKVRLNESSLFGKYPDHSLIYTNPVQYCHKRGFQVCKNMYMDNQDVNLDLPRFQDTLLKALYLLAT
ncbi:alpha-1,3-arabinosyltransferase XAT3-like [Salvia divinorum]|uniref:Alpha-1,3-arabinosyltransferase XAT3-like n=1 Tax=Salvia divinorum TaxID=28513 RepID=A0ABD1GJT1_SALDI